MKKIFLFVIFICIVATAYGKTQYVLDFTKESKIQDGREYLRSIGFEKKYDFSALRIYKTNRGLVFDPPSGGFLFYLNKFKKPFPAKYLRITWYFTHFPLINSWAENTRRQLLAVMVSFGTTPRPSGRFYMPAVPYFLSFFVNNIDRSDIFLGHYYKDTGRYVCRTCPVRSNQKIVTTINLEKEFSDVFGIEHIDNVTSVGLEMDTRNILTKNSAFRLIKIEFLSSLDPSPVVQKTTKSTKQVKSKK